MNKFIVSIVFLLSFIPINGKEKNTYIITDIPESFYGIWLPDSFLTSLKNDSNYENALKENDKVDSHDILIIEEGKIWSNVGFHDGYAISSSEFKKFKLTETPIKRVYDDNGNSYSFLSYGNLKNYRSIFKSFVLDHFNKKIMSISKNIAIEFSGEDIYILSQRPKLGPYNLLIDLYYLHPLKKRHYNFYIVKERIVLGINIEENKVYIDQIVDQKVLKDSVIFEREMNTINLFELN